MRPRSSETPRRISSSYVASGVRPVATPRRRSGRLLIAVSMRSAATVAQAAARPHSRRSTCGATPRRNAWRKPQWAADLAPAGAVLGTTRRSGSSAAMWSTMAGWRDASPPPTTTRPSDASGSSATASAMARCCEAQPVAIDLVRQRPTRGDGLQASGTPARAARRDPNPVWWPKRFERDGLAIANDGTADAGSEPDEHERRVDTATHDPLAQRGGLGVVEDDVGGDVAGRLPPACRRRSIRGWARRSVRRPVRPAPRHRAAQSGGASMPSEKVTDAPSNRALWILLPPISTVTNSGSLTTPPPCGADRRARRRPLRAVPRRRVPSANVELVLGEWGDGSADPIEEGGTAVRARRRGAP